MQANPTRRPIDRFIPWIFVLGFVVVIAVNGGLIYAALGSFSGLVSDHAYEQGRLFNAALKARATQEALGWRVALSVEPAVDGAARVLVEAHDRAGQPLSGAAVGVTLLRPVQPGHDHDVVLNERGSGRYAGTVAVDLAGQWDARIEIVRGADRYTATRRILEP